MHLKARRECLWREEHGDQGRHDDQMEVGPMREPDLLLLILAREVDCVPLARSCSLSRRSSPLVIAREGKATDGRGHLGKITKAGRRGDVDL